MNRRSVGEENKEEEERRIGGEETRRREEEEERMRGGDALFLAMQVMEIPAGGRGFPLVTFILQIIKSDFPTTAQILNKDIRLTCTDHTLIC